MGTLVHPPELNAYKRAMVNVFVRVVFCLVFLVGAYCAEACYRKTYPILSLYGPGPVVEAAIFLLRFAGVIYGALAIWSLRCAFVALWHPRKNE